ncbi:MAG: TlpA family protein disulfide reductase [Bacteroidales bacterium]|nr:TlpA family protein disulfide reductase [Bacteroidales bacterium]
MGLLISAITGCKQPKDNPQVIPETFAVYSAKMPAPVDSIFRMILGPLGNDRRVVIYPELKGIPDSLNNIRKFLFPVDDVQAVYQAYKTDLITKETMTNSLRDRINDTILCTADYVKTFIAIVTGRSKTGVRYYLIDTNNNYELSDESLFIMRDKIPPDQPHKVIFERFKDGNILQDSTWITFYSYRNLDALWMKFCEQTITSFTFDSVKYNLVVYPEYGLGLEYRDNAIFEITDSIHGEKQVFENNQYAHLGDLYYKANCSVDGKTIFFTLDTTALEKGSTQVNMPAIPFEAVTLKGDTVLFPEDFKGKYVLLDFWSTSCPHCIDDIRNCYKDLYNKYGGDHFELIGIADDPESRVERFVSQNMITWTMIPAPKSSIQKSYRTKVYPALYLINPEGIIIAKGQELTKESINSVFERYLGQM